MRPRRPITCCLCWACRVRSACVVDDLMCDRSMALSPLSLAFARSRLRRIVNRWSECLRLREDHHGPDHARVDRAVVCRSRCWKKRTLASLGESGADGESRCSWGAGCPTFARLGVRITDGADGWLASVRLFTGSDYLTGPGRGRCSRCQGEAPGRRQLQLTAAGHAARLVRTQILGDRVGGGAADGCGPQRPGPVRPGHRVAGDDRHLRGAKRIDGQPRFAWIAHAGGGLPRLRAVRVRCLSGIVHPIEAGEPARSASY